MVNEDLVWAFVVGATICCLLVSGLLFRVTHLKLDENDQERKGFNTLLIFSAIDAVAFLLLSSAAHEVFTSINPLFTFILFSAIQIGVIVIFCLLVSNITRKSISYRASIDLSQGNKRTLQKSENRQILVNCIIISIVLVAVMPLSGLLFMREACGRLLDNSLLLFVGGVVSVTIEQIIPRLKG